MKSSDRFYALGSELRLNVFRFVIKSGDDGRSAGEIAVHLDVPASTLSPHLKTLERAGLLESERQQKKLIYRVNTSELRQMIGFLVDDCCDRNPDLCGLQIAN